MKIGIDGRLWEETGVGRYIRNLVTYLSEIDDSNEYVLFFLSKDIENSKFKLVRADIRWHSLDEQLRFPSIIDREQVDLMHFPYFSVPIFYEGKFVVTIHDLIPLHFDTGLATTLPTPLYKAKRLGYKLVLRQTVKKASRIIAVSNATKEEIVRYLHVDPEKVVVTYEGVEDSLSAKLKTQNSKPQLKTQNFFLYVGNAYPHKNLERLLEAFKLAFARDSLSPVVPQNDIQLILVGKEDYFYARLKEKVKELGLSDQVIFYLPKGDNELAWLYQHAKALIMPSLMEGFGLPPLEAMSNNCLVMASDIPSIREVCGEIAVYFNPYDLDDIRKKMLLVCSDDLDQESRRKEIGLNRAKQFSWKKMAKETLIIYKEVANSSSSKWLVASG